ncbi:hypothetical protein MMC22_004315 [Lobaria immixta]|nr:hypothetical protein [Lobaria immixta]
MDDYIFRIDPLRNARPSLTSLRSYARLARRDVDNRVTEDRGDEGNTATKDGGDTEAGSEREVECGQPENEDGTYRKMKKTKTSEITRLLSALASGLKDLGFLFPVNFHAVHMPLKAG